MSSVRQELLEILLLGFLLGIFCIFFPILFYVALTKITLLDNLPQVFLFISILFLISFFLLKGYLVINLQLDTDQEIKIFLILGIIIGIYLMFFFLIPLLIY